MLGHQPVTLPFAARAGHSIRLPPRKKQQRFRIGCGQLHTPSDVFDIQPSLARLKMLQIPPVVRVKAVEAVRNGVPGNENQIFHQTRIMPWHRLWRLLKRCCRLPALSLLELDNSVQTHTSALNRARQASGCQPTEPRRLRSERKASETRQRGIELSTSYRGRQH